MKFIAFNTWTLLPMAPQKIKNLILECGLLWNMIIFKSEPPYYVFTLPSILH
jgi:hypothetical protein